MKKRGPLVLRALALAAAVLVATASTAAAQVPDPGADSAAEAARAPLVAGAPQPCAFERCGLRFQGGSILQGLRDERVAGLGDLYSDLRILETAGDSAGILALRAAWAHERGSLARHLGLVALLPLYALYPKWDDDRDYHRDAVWTHLGLGLTGLTLTFLGSHWERLAEGSVSRAVWWYNRDVAAGLVMDPDPPLPELDPDHFGRAGVVWGAGLAMLGGILISRDDLERGHALFELVVLPAAGAGLGWVIGRGIERH